MVSVAVVPKVLLLVAYTGDWSKMLPVLDRRILPLLPVESVPCS